VNLNFTTKIPGYVSSQTPCTKYKKILSLLQNCEFTNIPGYVSLSKIVNSQIAIFPLNRKEKQVPGYLSPPPSPIHAADMRVSQIHKCEMRNVNILGRIKYLDM
jgi:hypothetical protein